MRFVYFSFVTICLAKSIKLLDILDAAKHSKNEIETSDTLVQAAVKAKIEEDFRAQRLGSSRRTTAEQWESLWADGAIPDRPELGLYPGAVVNSHSSLTDLPSTPAFEGLVVTLDCGNSVSLAQTLSFGQQSGQAALFADALGATYGIAGLVMDPTVAGQERCPDAVPAAASGQKDQIIVWRRVVGAQDFLVGKVFSVHALSGKVSHTGQLRVLRNSGQTVTFEAVQLLTTNGTSSQIFAARSLSTPASESARPEFPILRGVMPLSTDMMMIDMPIFSTDGKML